MVGHNGIGADIDGEEGGEFEESVANPLTAMLETLGGEGVFPTEEGASDATGDAVVVGSGLQGDQGFPWLGHDIAP